MKHKLYPQMLEEIFDKYDGENKDILKKIPVFFKLLQSVYNEKISWISKFKINCCLSYFGVSQDVINDSTGPHGYYDDLFVCAYVIKELIPENKKILLKYWEMEENLEKSVDDILVRINPLLKGSINEILNFTGLSRFNRIVEDSVSREFKNDIEDRTSMIQLELLDLIGLLRMVLLNNGTSTSLNKLSELTRLRIRILKECFSKKEWEKVISVLEKIEFQETKFDNSEELEKDRGRERLLKRMEDIRRKVLLNIDEALIED